MTRSNLGRAAFAAAVAAALGIGARGAVAAPAAAKPYYCETTADCQARCDRMYPGQGFVGVCSVSHVCTCYAYR